MKSTASVLAHVAGGTVVAFFTFVACSNDTDRPKAVSDVGSSSQVPGEGNGGGSSGGASTSSGTASGSSGTTSSSGTTTSSGGSTSGGSSSGTGTSSSGDSGVTNPACQGVVRDGNAVDENVLTTTPPAGTGGSIAAGTYHLTIWETYNASGTAGLSGEQRKGTLVVNGTVIQIALTDIEQTGNVDKPTVAASFTTSGTKLNTTEVCPSAGDMLSRDYTATTNTFELFETFGNITRRFVYTKQ